MTKVLPAWRLEESQRGYDPATGKMTEWKRTGSFFEVKEATHDYIGEKTSQGPFFLMNLTKDPGAWAAVYFTRIIERSDEVLKVRDELGAQIAFAAYGKGRAWHEQSATWRHGREPPGRSCRCLVATRGIPKGMGCAQVMRSRKAMGGCR